MLKSLSIKNVALISYAEIEFDEKLNVLSGETGSGKSVILDSINFVLGSKADKTMIRFGEKEASVSCLFVVDENSEAVKKLNEYDIPFDGEIIISRKFSVDGKGSIRINGQIVTATMLKSVTAHLVDVHGQSEHFFLLEESNQLKMLDDISGEKIVSLKEQLQQLISKKREIKKQIASLGGNEQERETKLDFLKFQIDEIERAEIKVGEFDMLKERQAVIDNSVKIISSLGEAKALFSNDGGALDSLSKARHCLATISGYHEDYSQLLARLESVLAECDDIGESLSDLADELNFDESEAESISERWQQIKAMTKKYGGTEEAVLEHLEKCKKQYDEISDSANLIEKLIADIEKIDDKIFLVCKKMTEIRKNVAQTLCEGVVNELKTLNIPDAKCLVEFNDYSKDNAKLDSLNGSDEISFKFSANKGEPLKALNKVISGGEMSRFMLAVKTMLKNVNNISTYIFDEIDAGISGFTAKTMAEKFIDISQKTQIIAVSHLPQVCAASDSQFLIYKVEEDSKTVTRVKRLDEKEKIEEIMRLTGSNQSDAARQHAKELISSLKM